MITSLKRHLAPALLLLAVSAPLFAQTTTAFPGAYGFGAVATGGRGGAIYHVTNLNDSGPGSFRDAVSEGNRIVVFDVGGYIVLQSPVSVSSNLTIAGQTAPGGGIGIMAAEVSLSGKNNIIIRNLRMRQGNEDPLTGKSALNMGTATNIILDHCSFEYGQFDSVDAVGTVDFTVQNSIIADPIGQQFGAHVEVGPSTFYRNLWINAHNRQPLAKDDTQYINNVVYDYQAGYTVANTGGLFQHDIVNNYFIAGPATTSPGDAYFQINSNQSIYASGNMIDSTPDGVLNGTSANTVGSAVVLTAPWAATTTSIPTLDAADAYASLILSSGAFPRDSVDALVVSNVTSLGLAGEIYKDQAVTGLANNGYGNLASGTPFPNTSGDGIADYWATANGISTTDPTAGNAPYGTTGYTNVEAYINSLVLPTPWTAQDLTGTPVQGASSYNPFTSQWLLTGSGSSVPRTVDQGQFAGQPWSGTGTFTAELLASTAAFPSSSNGIMIRDSNANNAAFVALVKNGLNGLSFVWRSADGEVAQGLQEGHFDGPVWLRLVGQGGTFAAYYSKDGTHYRLFSVTNVSFTQSPQVGMVSASGSASVLGTASFTNVALTAGTGTPVNLNANSSSLVYPQSAILKVTVGASGEVAPGVVQIFDGSRKIAERPLDRGGEASFLVEPPLSAGTHLLTAAYSGDHDTAAGFSVAVPVTVAPASTRLAAACWNAFLVNGENYSCLASVLSDAGPATGSLNYTLDGTAFATPLRFGVAEITLQHPAVGTHTVSIAYPQQGNFAASNVITNSFTVVPAPGHGSH